MDVRSKVYHHKPISLNRHSGLTASSGEIHLQRTAGPYIRVKHCLAAVLPQRQPLTVASPTKLGAAGLSTKR